MHMMYTTVDVVLAAISWPHLPIDHLKEKLLHHMSAVLTDGTNGWRLTELACGFAATYHTLLAKVMFSYVTCNDDN